MKRWHFFEIEDQAWCPSSVRDAVTDFLAVAATRQYEAIVPVLVDALHTARSHRILDLCSGGSGPWLWLHRSLAERGVNVVVSLSDKYPNVKALAHSASLASQTIDYCRLSVDATNVPVGLDGFRTMFTAFHHFGSEQARAVLADAVLKRQGIGIFEITQRRPLAFLLMLLSPLVVLVVTPSIRPFRWSRLLWTYLIPLVPAVALFDGFVSCLRTYGVEELRELTAGIGGKSYHWKIGALKSRKSPIPVTYLIGVPIEPPPNDASAMPAIYKLEHKKAAA